MRLLNNIGLFGCLLLVSIGCSSEQKLQTTPQGEQIKFNCFLEEGDKLIPMNGSVSGASRAEADNNLTAGFELYGVWNTKDMPTTFIKGNNTSTEDGRFFFDNYKITWDATTASYEYAGAKRYWIADGKARHSFVARTIDPLGSSGSYNRGGNTNGGFIRSRWIPTINYHVHPDPAQQHDLLVASGPMNIVVRGATPAVNLYFKHALSKIRFKFLSSAGATLYKVNLSITYVGELKRGFACSFTAEEESALSLTAADGVSYVLASNLVIPASASDERSAFMAGEFLVQPQTPANSWIEISLSYSLSDGGVSKSAKLGIPPGVTFKPGMQYTYYVRVADQPETLIITNLQLEPWMTEYKEVDPL